MNLRGLSFEAMPPLMVPYRFFMVAPLSIIAIGLLWLFASPDELTSRWSHLLLATTHGITLGFMLMVMFGALFQVLPVVTGIAIPRAGSLSRWVHFFLVTGVAGLITGFTFAEHLLLIAGAASSFVAFVIFVSALLSTFPGMQNKPTSWAIRLATLGLIVTIGLGLFLVLGLLEIELFKNFRSWTNVHLLWGIIGWALLLIMGVSFQIIPMFYVTPDYPKWITQLLPVVIIFQLIVFSISKFMTLPEKNLLSIQIQLLLLTLTASCYPVYTLYLLGQRKRRVVDITIWFWKTAMCSFVIAAVLFTGIIFYQGLYLKQMELILAVLVLVGFAMALITGMLLKIVPFLVWLNIQQKWIKHPSRKMPLSNMQQVIPVEVAKRQYILFISILPLLLIIFSGMNPVWLIKFIALLLMLTFGYLYYCLYAAKRLYERLDAQLDETLHSDPAS